MANLLLAVTAVALLAQAAQGEKSEIETLLAQNENLLNQFEKNDKDKVQIGEATLTIQGADTVLKRAEEALNRTVSGLSNEIEAFANKARATQNNGCPWGRQAEPSYANSCNAELKEIGRLADQLRGKENGLIEFKKALEQKRKKVTTDTLKLAGKQKTNNADRRLLEQERSDWLRRYQGFKMRSEAFERLKRMAPIAAVCGSENSTMSLTAAKACLDGLWDNMR